MKWRTALLMGGLSMWMSCATTLERPAITDSGKVKCDPERDSLVWEGRAANGDLASCTVYVRLKAPAESSCRPALYKPGPGGGRVGVTSRPDAGDATIQVTERLSQLFVACEGAASERECEYEIVKVVCDANPAAVNDRAVIAQLERQHCPCGDANEKSLWTRPAPKRNCKVTVKLTATANCQMELYSRPPAAARAVASVDRRGQKLVTVVNVRELTAKCLRVNAGEENCTAVVVSTECD